MYLYYTDPLFLFMNRSHSFLQAVALPIGAPGLTEAYMVLCGLWGPLGPTSQKTYQNPPDKLAKMVSQHAKPPLDSLAGLSGGLW